MVWPPGGGRIEFNFAGADNVFYTTPHTYYTHTHHVYGATKIASFAVMAN